MMSDAETKPRLLSRALRPGPDELFQLGFQLSRRSGGPAADRLTAYALFDLAARQGSIEAKVYRHELSGEMEPSEIVDAQQLARVWLNEP